MDSRRTFFANSTFSIRSCKHTRVTYDTVKALVSTAISGLTREFIKTQDPAGNAAVLIEQEVNVAGVERLKLFLVDIAQQMNSQDKPLKTLQYEYRGLEEQHADAGNQCIPETTSTSEHTSSVKVLMKFAEVVVQGLEERFVDRNGMAHFGVMTASRIPS